MQNELTINTNNGHVLGGLTPANGTKWLSGADELLGWLSRHKEEKDSWWRAQSATIALLKQAEKSLEAAQARLQEQQERISQLEAIATTDELTGINNRRGFFTQFYKELDRANRGQSEGGLLIMIDLDNFKAINDTHGHQAGDMALKLVAKTLVADIRIMDTAARLGGDEFVLLLSNTDRIKAAARARDLVGRLNSLSLIWFGAEIPVRASLGLREYAKGDTPERIFSDADASMYENKLGNKFINQQEAAAVR